jgi:hypothetical protein
MVSTPTADGNPQRSAEPYEGIWFFRQQRCCRGGKGSESGAKLWSGAKLQKGKSGPRGFLTSRVEVKTRVTVKNGKAGAEAERLMLVGPVKTFKEQ